MRQSIDAKVKKSFDTREALWLAPVLTHLVDAGETVSKKTVAASMRHLGLWPDPRRRSLG